MRIARRLLLALKARLDRLNDIADDAGISAECWISGSVISGPATIAEGCKIYKAQIEGRVSVARHSSLWGPGLFVMGRQHGVSIGSFCSIARHVSIQEDSHNPQRTTTYFVERNLLREMPDADETYSKGPIVIGNDVWIGAAAQVQSGVRIGHGAIIAGGAIVTSDVPPYAIVAGNPARVVRYRFGHETIDRLLADAWWDWPVERLRAERAYLTATHEKPG